MYRWRFRVYLTWVLLLFGLLACQSNQIEPTPTVTMTRMSQPDPTEPARSLPTATLVPTPAALQPVPTATMAATVAALQLPPIPAPAGWKFAGNRQTGIQLAMPEDWVDFTGLLDGVDAGSRFGALQLIVADSKTTGTQLINDNFNSGRFALAFTLPATPGQRPETTLLEMLAVVAPPPNPIISAAINGYALAYTDVTGDPLQLISRDASQMALRLVLLNAPDDAYAVLLALGTRPDEFAAATPLFEELLTTVQLAGIPAVNEAIVLPAQVEAQLSHGQVYAGTLANQETHYFSFMANGGQYVTVVAEPVTSLDLEIALIDPNGRTVASGDNGYAYDPELIVDAVMPRNGTYFLEISDFFGQGGDYTLTLLISDTPQYTGGEIAFGQEVTSRLLANEQHAWVFEGTAGQTISIIATPLNEQMDIVLRLYGPDGEKLIELDEGFSGDPEVIAGYVLDVSAAYTIEVKDFSARNGDYTLSLDEGGDEVENFYDAGDLRSGDFKQEVLQENEIQAWFFFGFAGDEISIILSPINNNVDLMIWLLSPELERLATVDATLAGESERLDITLAADGQYIILVQDFFGEPGSYQISYTVNQNLLLEDAGFLPYNQAVNATLPAGQTMLWRFSVLEDEIISVKATPLTASSDLVLVLRGPDGYLQFTLDNTGSGGEELLLEFTVPAGGNWIILVREFQGRATSYRLKVEHR
ncbi:MAG: hypothetical protein KDE04_02575 [Anaerolineales bacterium]|nr:hypothetical protein [Anaerolineales bacterium]